MDFNQYRFFTNGGIVSSLPTQQLIDNGWTLKTPHIGTRGGFRPEWIDPVTNKAHGTKPALEILERRLNLLSLNPIKKRRRGV